MDRDTGYLEVAKALLAGEGVVVESVKTSREALEMALSKRFDAILADYSLPELDSIGLLKTLRVQGNIVPFVLVTDPGREDVASMALREGADFYVYKSRDPKGHFAEVARVIRLLVEKSDAERQLRERDILYRTLFENTGTALVVYGPGGIIVHVNAEFERVTGYSRSEVEGVMNGFDLLAPEDRERVFEMHSSKSDESCSGMHVYDMLVVDKWGNKRKFSAAMRKVPNADLMIASFVDVSRYSSTEAPGRAASPHFRVLAENCGDLLYRIRLKPNFMFEYVSPTSTAMVGYTPEEHYADPSLGYKIVHPDDRPLLDAVRNDPSKFGTPFVSRWVRRDGTILWTEQLIHPVKDDRGDIVALEAVARDVTERVLTEQALVQANRRLVLMGSITRHDLMNQLSVMTAGLDLAIDTSTEPVVRDQIAMSRESVEKMRALLELTSEYRDMGMTKADWVEMRGVCSDCLRSHRLDGVRAEIDLDGLSILADPMIKRAFSSLVDNTLRHNTGVSRIGFTFRRENGSVVLIVEDDGVGIPHGEKERIFQRGYGKNTGYGLYFVKEVLGITGMTIRETGTPGQGARFEITVPENSFRFGQPGQNG